MKKAKEFFKRLYKIITLEEMRILPGQLAFFMVFTLISIFSIIGYVGSNFITHELISSVEDTLPTAVSSILKSILEGKESGINIIFFIVCSIYIASNGCGAMIITSNTIYKIKNDNVVKQKIKAIIMTLVLMMLLLFIVLVPACGELIINLIKRNFSGRLIETIEIIFNLCKLPLSILLIFIGVKILYTLAPDKRLPSRYTTYGAMFTTVFWILVTKVYATYLNSINTYDIFYGSLANIVILLFWVYLLAYVFTLGIALNVDHYYDGKESVK